MLARAQAMRDLTPESAANLQKAYEQLDERRRAEQSLWLVDVFLRMKRPELARALVEKHTADKADSDTDCSWLEAVGRYDFESNNPEAARAILNSILDSKAASNALKSRALTTLGEGAYYANDFAAAEKSVRSAIDIYPKNFAAQIIAGRVALKTKDAKLAIDFAKKALETDPYDARAEVVMGQAQMQLGDLKAAAASLRKAIALYPALPEAHKALAEVLNKQSLLPEARKEADLAAKLEAQEK
jgi:tetratricopeptide (TPR) repeat protein